MLLQKILHKIEWLNKKFLNIFIQNNYSPQKITQAEEIFVNLKNLKVLLLRHDRIGDVLITTPFLKELRRILPNEEIDILLSFKNKTVRRSVEYLVDDIMVLENKPLEFFKLIHKIRGKQYDMVIDLLDNESASSNMILKYSTAKIKLGFDKSNSNNYNFVVPIPDKGQVHIVRRLFSLLLPFGYDIGDKDIRLEFPLKKSEQTEAVKLLGKKDSEIRLGINLSGSNDSKYWGDEKYISFIKKVISSYDADVLLFALPKLKIRADYIASQCGGHIAPMQTDFNIYAAMLNECDIILTPDTAAVHLASAFNKPVIALFVSPHPDINMPWFPLNSKSKSFVAEHSYEEIKVSDVFEAFSDLVEGLEQ